VSELSRERALKKQEEVDWFSRASIDRAEVLYGGRAHLCCVEHDGPAAASE